MSADGAQSPAGLRRQPLPVLLMVRTLDLGGSERQLTEIAKALDRERFQPHVGCFHRGGVRDDELKAAGVPVVRFPVTSFRSPSVLTAGMALGRYVRRHQIALLHTFDVPTTLFAVPAGRLCRDIVVLSSQRAHRDLTPGVMRRLLRVTDRLANGVVVNCQSIRRELVENDGVPDSAIHLCYNGIDTETFSPGPARRPAALDSCSLVVGTVAALRPEKDLATLLRAFAVVRTPERPAKLVIVGGGPCSADLRTLAENLGIERDCIFEPAAKHMVDWLRLFDIFVLPSRSEALSNSLMEAMACGTAVVASRVGGNPELVRHDETGILFAAGDSRELSAALQRLADDEGQRRALGLAARQLVKDRFSLSKSAARMAEIYAGVLAENA